MLTWSVQQIVPNIYNISNHVGCQLLTSSFLLSFVLIIFKFWKERKIVSSAKIKSSANLWYFRANKIYSFSLWFRLKKTIPMLILDATKITKNSLFRFRLRKSLFTLCNLSYVMALRHNYNTRFFEIRTSLIRISDWNFLKRLRIS